MAIGSVQTEGDLERFVQRRIEAAVAPLRRLNGLVISGSGAPAGAPTARRATYIRLDGAGGSTLYYWNGSAWSAVA